MALIQAKEAGLKPSGPRPASLPSARLSDSPANDFMPFVVRRIHENSFRPL
jgi:hypothetical protein